MQIEEWLGKDNQLGIDIWKKKYCHNNETFEEWLDRISNGNDIIRQLIIEKKFLFGGRILSNRGLAKEGRKITYSNCYVIPAPEDNLESIFDTAKYLARTYSYGGGCGVDLGKLAPNGAKVRNAAKTSSGAVSFMDFYSAITGLISQNGRRGALMLSMPINHPDIEEFIGIKSDLSKVTKANISVRVTDDFMQAVKEGKTYHLSFTREATGETIEKDIDAKEFFHRLCELNWDYAEPGLLYWDTIKNKSLISGYDNFEYAGVNPCAEEPLPSGGSCLLGSLNLAEFVEGSIFNTRKFSFAVREAVRALNEVLDEGLPLHPLAIQQESVRDWRQIGLGIFGLADCLIKQGIRYGSPQAVAFSEAIGQLLMNEAIAESIVLAQEKGPFPKFSYIDTMRSTMFMEHLPIGFRTAFQKYGIRNSQLLTCAPTGTLSTMLGVSGGIEPIFANYYTRKTESLHGHDEYYKVYTPIVKQYMEENELKDDSELPEFFVTAHELKPSERIAMQSAWQNHIDASISSTVNLPKEATVEEVERLYMQAWENGLKGITIFREGCARVGVLTTSEKKEEKKETKEENKPVRIKKSNRRILRRGEIIAVDDNLIGVKKKLMSGCGTLHCEAFFDKYDGSFREIYLSKGSTGGCNNFMVGLSRMISLAARGGIELDDIVDQLMSTGACPSYRARTVTQHDTSQGSCCPMAVGYALKEMQNEILEYIVGEEKELSNPTEVTFILKKAPVMPLIEPKEFTIPKEKCPECGAELEHINGCIQCPSCGYSKCD